MAGKPRPHSAVCGHSSPGRQLAGSWQHKKRGRERLIPPCLPGWYEQNTKCNSLYDYVNMYLLSECILTKDLAKQITPPWWCRLPVFYCSGAAKKNLQRDGWPLKNDDLGVPPYVLFLRIIPSCHFGLEVSDKHEIIMVSRGWQWRGLSCGRYAIAAGAPSSTLLEGGMGVSVYFECCYYCYWSRPVGSPQAVKWGSRACLVEATSISVVKQWWS
jgi:hypothetical protein